MTYNTLRTSGESDDFFTHKRLMTTSDPNTTYKVLRQTTEGWTLVDENAQNLTKEQCDQVLNTLVQMEGIAPHALRAVKEN